MCTVSMVMDHYKDAFTVPQIIYTQTDNLTPAELAELRALIKEFKEAVKAAKLLDKVLKQPDCVDPQKAKLEKRVRALERRLGI